MLTTLPPALRERIAKRKIHFVYFHICVVLLLAAGLVINLGLTESNTFLYTHQGISQSAISSVKVKSQGGNNFNVAISPDNGKIKTGEFDKLNGLLEFQEDVYLSDALMEKFHLTPPLKMSCIFNNQSENVVVYITDKNLTMTKDTLWLSH